MIIIPLLVACVQAASQAQSIAHGASDNINHDPERYIPESGGGIQFRPKAKRQRSAAAAADDEPPAAMQSAAASSNSNGFHHAVMKRGLVSVDFDETEEGQAGVDVVTASAEGGAGKPSGVTMDTMGIDQTSPVAATAAPTGDKAAVVAGVTHHQQQHAEVGGSSSGAAKPGHGKQGSANTRQRKYRSKVTSDDTEAA